MPEIVLKNVTKRWGDFVAVDNLNMTIEDRDFITLLGPSGCGKTTTLRMIAGLETPTEGTITIGGRTVFDSERGINISPDKRDIGFLFQNYALWPHMTVYQNISFGLENMKWKKADIKARVAEMLKLLKIEEFSSRYPAEPVSYTHLDVYKRQALPCCRGNSHPSQAGRRSACGNCGLRSALLGLKRVLRA